MLRHASYTLGGTGESDSREKEKTFVVTLDDADTQFAYTRAHCLLDVVIGLHLTALPPPIHLPLPLASPKTKTPRSLGDIPTD